MEYANKRDYLANKILEEHTPIKNQIKLRQWTEDCLEALNYMHNNRIIHIDLKLENILMKSPDDDESFNIPKICDFGLAHIVDPCTGLAPMQVKCGTKGYMAPEIGQVRSPVLC